MRMSKCRLGLCLLLPALFLGGCASQGTAEQAAAAQTNGVEQNNDVKGDPRDPLESFNRAMWTFNWDYLDTYVARPVAVVYRDYMPGFARTGLLNAAINLEEPANSVNNLLQGKVGDSMVSLGRFLLNSTIGLLGTIDVAGEIGMERKSEEFGEVLGVWGVSNGAYVMLPVYGANDVRGGVGDLVDSAYWPMDTLNLPLSLFRWGIDAVETRIKLMDQEQLLDGAVDPYALVKDIYFQNTEFKVKDGKVEQSKEDKQLDDDIDAYLDQL
ncbi:ABC transporter [Bowmanella pacifica]|uniref:ABC transporter n=2 Tax=Bowmanella pacifica TaxID=502051 RepID=A0A917YXU0_9ALTE|nr:ABC transporter [Bowmanella pacifica]